MIRRLWRWKVGRAKRAYDRAHYAGESLLVIILVVVVILIILGVVVVR